MRFWNAPRSVVYKRSAFEVLIAPEMFLVQRWYSQYSLFTINMSLQWQTNGCTSYTRLQPTRCHTVVCQYRSASLICDFIVCLPVVQSTVNLEYFYYKAGVIQTIKIQPNPRQKLARFIKLKLKSQTVMENHLPKYYWYDYICLWL